MFRVKGCVNSECSTYHKTRFKESDKCCAQCGSELVYICLNPKCFKKLPDGTRKRLCSIHDAELKDTLEMVGTTAKKVGNGIVAVGITIGSLAKVGSDILKKK